MPRREDENWVRWREDSRGEGRRALCPFCGKDDKLYYDKHFKSWGCGWCEKSFPTPSGGKPFDKKDFEWRFKTLGLGEDFKKHEGTQREIGEWVRFRQAGGRIRQKKALCPFCGKSDELEYNSSQNLWRCISCVKIFPKPSGGESARLVSIEPNVDRPQDKRQFKEQYKGFQQIRRRRRKALVEKILIGLGIVLGVTILIAIVLSI